MAKTRIEANVQHIIIVEGTHDQDFLEQLLRDNGLSSASIQVLPLGGKTVLGSNLKLLVKDPAFPNIQSLMILRDADSIVPDRHEETESPNQQVARSAALRSMDSVRSSLSNAGLSVPIRHAEFTAATPRVGVFIFPDGQADGMLESLCREALGDHEDATCIDAFFLCVSEKRSDVQFSPKAWTHAYISVQEDPDLHLGKAAKKGYLPLQSDTFGNLVQFFRTVLSVGAQNPPLDAKT